MIGDDENGRPFLADTSAIRTLTAELADQLRAVPASHDGTLEYKPCVVTLRDGTLRDCVYVQEVTIWLGTWGAVWSDAHGVPLADVVAIASSPSRLPVEIADAIYAAGESGMGYCVFTLELANGTSVPCLTGNAVDFVDLPEGVRPADVTGVRVHHRVAQSGVTARGANANSALCLYRLGV